jgi:hypothetical protein
MSFDDKNIHINNSKDYFMKKMILLSMLLISSYTFANQLCTIHIDAKDFNSIQISRVTKLLQNLNYKVVSKSERANYKVKLEKNSYFNLYGYPHFFMREISLDFYGNGVKLYETFSSDGFPVYRALGQVLDDLEVNENFCS